MVHSHSLENATAYSTLTGPTCEGSPLVIAELAAPLCASNTICRPRGDCEAFCTALGNCTAISIEPQPFGTSSRPGCTFFSDCTTSETVNHTTFSRSAVLRKFKAP